MSRYNKIVVVRRCSRSEMVRGGVLSLLLLLPIIVVAQQEWEKEGGIPSAEIEIVKDRQIILPQADRAFEKIPPRPSEPIKPEISYQFKNIRFNTAGYSPALRPLKLKQEDITKIYGNFVSGGFGNYSSPYLEGSLSSKRSKTAYYGLRGFHHSYGTGPVDGKNSASGTSEINLYGKAMSNSVVASGSIDYSNRTTTYYGYVPGSDPSKDAIRQSYNSIGVSLGIENARSADFNYFLKGYYNYLSNRFQATEGEANLSYGSTYSISDNSRFVLDADYYLMNKTPSSEVSSLPPAAVPVTKVRNLFHARPAYLFTPMAGLWVTAGANMAYENDDIGAKKSLHFYPNLKIDFAASEDMSLYAGLSGDIDKVSFHTFAQENNWVNSDLPIYNTNRSIELLAGLKGNLNKKIAYGAGLSVANLKNLYFYQNDSTNRARFTVVYDIGDVKRINPFVELGYSHGESVKLGFRGDYYKYATDKIADAYHRPTYRAVFNSTYNLYSKLQFNIDFFLQGGAKAYDFETTRTVTLKTATDLNARIDYFVSRQVSVFLKCDNILSNQYQIYLNYPVRGLQAMGGLTWSF